MFWLHPFFLALIFVIGIEAVSLVGLALFRRYVTPRLDLHDGLNDAVSGTVQAIGVFYGITIGLIAVGVWNTWTGSAELVSREASYIGSLYRDFNAFPEPLRGKTQGMLRDYTQAVIDDDWPAQMEGQHGTAAPPILDALEDVLLAYEPAGAGAAARYRETLAAYNRVLQQRHLRIDAVDGGLSDVMWAVIWVGAGFSIFVAYFFLIRDARVHAALIAMISGFLAMVLFLIVVNDKPFYGRISIPPDSYRLVLQHTMGAR
jgi:hypothetical protein